MGYRPQRPCHPVQILPDRWKCLPRLPRCLPRRCLLPRLLSHWCFIPHQCLLPHRCFLLHRCSLPYDCRPHSCCSPLARLLDHIRRPLAPYFLRLHTAPPAPVTGDRDQPHRRCLMPVRGPLVVTCVVPLEVGFWSILLPGHWSTLPPVDFGSSQSRTIGLKI